MTCQDSALSVLLVDDEVELGQALAKVLIRRGLRVEVATSAAAALEKLGTQTFQVALVDVKMPEVDGLQLLDLIGKLAPAMHRLAWSGDPGPRTLQEIQARGLECLAKPLSPEAVLARIREICGGPASSAGRDPPGSQRSSKLDPH